MTVVKMYGIRQNDRVSGRRGGKIGLIGCIGRFGCFVFDRELVSVVLS